MSYDEGTAGSGTDVAGASWAEHAVSASSTTSIAPTFPTIDTIVPEAVVDAADFQLMHDSMLGEFRQALANCQLALATANAQNKVKDRIIAELRAELEPQA